MDSIPADLQERLRRFGQDHVLAWWDSLSSPERSALVEQLAALDLAELQRLHAGRGRKDQLPDLSRLAPLPHLHESRAEQEHFRDRAKAALAQGEVAFLVVAGGQGTRLGFPHPKGMFPVGPVSGKTLFQFHAEKILALARRHGKPLPFLIMTSSATHEETVAFFTAQRSFGLPPEQVHFFRQGAMPALDYETGKLLLEAPGRLALSPNGHGGTLAALDDSGLLDRLEAGGIRTISYFQVDNALTNLADLLFLGRHLDHRAQVSSKVLPKRHPKEKVGNFALVDGRCSMIEYSDLPEEWAQLKNPHHSGADDSLFFWAANPAIHLFDVGFLRQLCRHHGGSIPWHLAKKKQPYLDTQGKLVQPTSENALKFERFIFDTLPLAERWTVEPTTRAEDFEPLKNASGDDSPETVRRALVTHAATMLAAAGIAAPRSNDGTIDPPVEISPLFALDADDLRRKLRAPLRFDRPLYLE